MGKVRALVTLVLLAGAALLSVASSDDGSGGGPMCRKGCPCGNACISCMDTCHMLDDGTEVPAEGATVVGVPE